MPVTLSMAKNRFKYTPVQQLGLLKTRYGGIGGPTRDGIVWQGDFTPTPLSYTYRLKIEYQKGNYPKVYIVNPKPLPLAAGASKLPHTYDSKKQRICLFKPDLWEWTSSMSIADTIVHWAVLWMFFYESWVCTGKWLGGGHGNWDVTPKEQEKEL